MSLAPEDPTPDPTQPVAPVAPTEGDLPHAVVRGRRLLSPIWAIPIVAALVAGFLGWRALEARGPVVTIAFKTADGLQAGQTKVRYKSVELGTVSSITLAKGLGAVLVRVQMQRVATEYLTDKTHFWVVRPRLTAGNISGLDTLISGAYIGMDPGPSGGALQTHFTGLEEPPAIRSDEPGTTFVLKTSRIGSLGTGSPVFFHDIKAGEVLGYDLGPHGDSVTVHVFIAAPYDAYVNKGTQFWNASGVSVDLGAQGLRVRLESLLAALTGGIAFDTPADAADTARAKRDEVFALYPDAEAAKSASFRAQLPAVAYFEQSVRGLAAGAPVEMYGLQVGTVTGVKLDFDPLAGKARVAVNFEVQPQRIFPFTGADQTMHDAAAITQRLLNHGIRVELTSANILTGQMVLSLVFVPNAPHVTVTRVGGAILLPTAPGGFDSIVNGAGAIMAKLNALPLQEIATNLNTTLKSASTVMNGPELRHSLTALAQAMESANSMIRNLQAGVEPAAKQLPQIAQGVQAALDRTSKLLGSANAGYGADSQFRREMDRLLGQVSEAARSVRLLADYLNQHPDALLRGRAGRAGN